MKQITKIMLLTAFAVAVCAAATVLYSPSAQAGAPGCTPSANQKCCGDVPVTIDVGCREGEIRREGLAMAYIYAIIRIVTGVVGAAVVGAIIFGGLTYMTARDNAAQAQKGIVIIRTAIIALIFFIFSATLISFLIPGGLFSNA